MADPISTAAKIAIFTASIVAGIVGTMILLPREAPRDEGPLGSTNGA